MYTLPALTVHVYITLTAHVNILPKILTLQALRYTAYANKLITTIMYICITLALHINILIVTFTLTTTTSHYSAVYKVNTRTSSNLFTFELNGHSECL